MIGGSKNKKEHLNLLKGRRVRKKHIEGCPFSDGESASLREEGLRKSGRGCRETEFRNIVSLHPELEESNGTVRSGPTSVKEAEVFSMSISS